MSDLLFSCYKHDNSLIEFNLVRKFVFTPLLRYWSERDYLTVDENGIVFEKNLSTLHEIQLINIHALECFTHNQHNFNHGQVLYSQYFFFKKNSFFNIQHNLTRQFCLQLDSALDEQAGREKKKPDIEWHRRTMPSIEKNEEAN